MKNGGKRPGAGRKKGVPNKKTQVLEEILANLGCFPLEKLAMMAKGEPILCTTFIDKEGGEVVEEMARPTIDQQKDACKELLSYIYAKRKAVEHTGANGDPIVFSGIEITLVRPND